MDLLDDSKKASKKTTTLMKVYPFFSIIIPVFKAKDYIARCMKNCTNQTFQDLEIIIIDDCGEDETIEIAKNYARQDQRIIILHNPQNLGAFHSRLRGIHQAKGKYLIFVDCDDFISLDTLETLYQNIQQNSADIIHYRFSYFPNNILKPSPKLKNSMLKNPKIYQTLNTNTVFQSICDKAFKSHYAKLVAKKLSFIQEPFSCMEDGLFFLVASFEIQSYISLDKILYFYQNNPQSTTKLVDKKVSVKKLRDFNNGLKIIQIVKTLYPQHLEIIQQYEQKIVSAYILEGRRYAKQDLQNILKLISKYHFSKQVFFPLSTYLKSTLLSIKYFYRWQTVVRFLLNIFSFGKVKL